MERLAVKAATTVAAKGRSKRLISTEDVDRELDVVDPETMATALQKWNRPIPLAWNHSTKAEDSVGHIDPESVQVVGGEVMAMARSTMTSGSPARHGGHSGPAGRVQLSLP